jgi:hypothetical protein
MKCAVEMALCDMIYVASLMKIGTGVQAIAIWEAVILVLLMGGIF